MDDNENRRNLRHWDQANSGRPSFIGIGFPKNVVFAAVVATASQHKQQIGQSIQKDANLRVDARFLLQPQNINFGPATNASGDMHTCRQLSSTGQNKAA